MLRFQNGRFRIMQIADIQEATVVSKDTTELLRLALAREKPDLAVLTGDQLYGLLPFFRLGDPHENARRVLETVTAPLAEAGVPFVFTFGNHDAQCGVNKREQADIYYALPGCIRPVARCERDPGTFLLPVYGKDGAVRLTLAVFDSGAQKPDGEYLPVSPEQLCWFTETLQEQRERLGGQVDTLVFQHIPVPEYYDALQRATRFTKGAVEAFRTHKNEFYILPETVRAKGGFMGEAPATPDRNAGEFDMLVNSGCVRGLFVGHDHYNSFEAELRGIRIFYTQCCGFHVYGPHEKRGFRVIEIDEASPAAFTTHTVTRDMLTDKPLKDPILECILTHIPSSMEQVKRLAGLGAAAGGAALIGLSAYRKCRRSRRGRESGE